MKLILAACLAASVAFTPAQSSLVVRTASFANPDWDQNDVPTARVAVLVEIPNGVAPAARASMSLDVQVRGSRDRLVHAQVDSFNANLDANEVPADLATTVRLSRGRHRVQATLRAGDFVASGSAVADIPDFMWAGLTMSDVVFSSDERRVRLADAALGLLPVAPVARFEFRLGDRVSAFARLHAGRSTEQSPVTMTVTIARTGQRPVFTDVTPATPSYPGRTADYRLWLPLDQLGAGDWTLVLRARSEARHTATREVTFTVR